MLVKDAPTAFQSEDRLAADWRGLGYSAQPDWAAAEAESLAFTELLESLGTRVVRLPADRSVGPDSLYVRDASVMCRRGAILGRMGKPAREGEPAAQRVALEQFGVPIMGQIGSPGRLEGGDVVWLDERTIAVGWGYRTNAEGIAQLTQLLEGLVDQVLVAHMPHGRGPADVFHLMSALSPVDHDLALVYSPHLSVPFRQQLLARGCKLIEVPDDEYPTLGCNVLTVAPRRCIMVAGNPVTRTRLEASGVEVHTIPGRELCLKGSGGPTCLTRPLRRGRLTSAAGQG